MITPSFSLTASERVLPKLALDFTTGLLDSRVTFIRTTDATHPATYVNSSGYLASAANNSPRFEYDPITLVCKGLLIEESRTNSVPISNDFTTWTNGSRITNNTVVSPENVQNGASLVSSSTVALHKTFSLTATQYTASIFVKAGASLTSFTLYLATAGVAAGSSCVFNLANGTASSVTNYGSTTGSTASITKYGNGWYRCSITILATAATYYFEMDLSTPSTMYVYGAQLEAGSFATSYIPTTSAALTRNADVATMTGTNFSDWFNASEGTFAVSSSNATPVATQTLWALYLDANNIIYTRRRFSTGPTFQFVQVAAGTAPVSIQTGTIDPYANGAIVNTCAGYKLNDFALSINGVNTGVDTSSSAIGAYTSFQIGTLNGAAFFNGWVRKINYYPQKLTLAEINAFSK